MAQFHDNAIMLHELHDTIRTGARAHPILNETIAGVTDILGRELEGMAVERAVIGLFFTGVKLTAGRNSVPTAGTCAPPRNAAPGDICCPIAAHQIAFRHFAGRPAAELMH
jgi:hypothetical protein